MDTLYTAPGTPGQFKSYPPASVLWEVMILQATGSGYREDIALFAQAFLSVLLLVYPLKAIKEKQIFSKALLYAILLVTVFAVYPRGIYMLGVDVLLGLAAGVVVLAEFLPNRSPASAAVEILGCVLLCTTKGSGVGVAVLLLVVVLVHRVLLKEEMQPASPIWKRFLTPACMAAAVLLSKISWTVHIHMQGTEERWQSEKSFFENIGDLLTGKGPDYQSEVSRLFFKEVAANCNYGTFLAFPFLAFLLFFILLGVAAYFFWNKEKRRTAVIAFSSMTAACLIYMLSLLYTYLFIFHKVEALQLASVSRYLNTFLVPLLVFGLSMVCVAASEHGPAVRCTPIALLLICAVMISSPADLVHTFVNAPIHAAQTGHDSYIYRRGADRIRSLGEGEALKTHLVTTYDGGMTQMRVEYELIPEMLKDQHAMMRPVVNEELTSVREISCDEWRQELLDGYEYVYLFGPEAAFTQEFAPLFRDQDMVVVDKMFRVMDDGEYAILENMPEITQNPQPDC